MIECKVEQGVIEVGSKLTLLPSYLPAQALSILNSQGKQIDRAFRDELITMKLNVGNEQQVDIG